MGHKIALGWQGSVAWAFCLRCGGVATTKPMKLRQQCRPPTKPGEAFLRALRQGRDPKWGKPLVLAGLLGGRTGEQAAPREESYNPEGAEPAGHEGEEHAALEAAHWDDFWQGHDAEAAAALDEENQLGLPMGIDDQDEGGEALGLGGLGIPPSP